MSAPRGDLIPPSTLFAYPEDHARSHPEKPAFPAPRSVSLRNSHVRTAEVGHVVKSIETLPSSRSPVPRRPDPPHHHRCLIEGIVAAARGGSSRGGIRFSPHFYNMEVDIERAIDAIGRYMRQGL